jgi:FtsP/CotA-like multicopper oxidase with cupredoxin domain
LPTTTTGPRIEPGGLPRARVGRERLAVALGRHRRDGIEVLPVAPVQLRGAPAAVAAAGAASVPFGALPNRPGSDRHTPERRTLDGGRRRVRRGEDAHPIHIHEVQFQVVNREPMDGSTPPRSPEAWEAGFKNTVIAYPGEVTRVKSTFDLPGRYVWHCHIVEHEDNETMRPYQIG